MEDKEEKRMESKGKAVPLHTYSGVGRKRRYSSCSFTISELDGVSSQCHAPAALYPRRKDPRYPLGRLGGPQSRSTVIKK
jgi:hypothetical protein